MLCQSEACSGSLNFNANQVKSKADQTVKGILVLFCPILRNVPPLISLSTLEVVTFELDAVRDGTSKGYSQSPGDVFGVSCR